MSENSYAPPSLTMGHLSIKLRNLFISIHHVHDKFSILSIYYILILHFSNLRYLSNSKIYLTTYFDERKLFGPLTMLEVTINYQLTNT